jgi:hypothetical protein
MKTITLCKVLNFKCGISLHPHREYLATPLEDGRWMIHLSDTIRLMIVDKFVQTVA